MTGSFDVGVDLDLRGQRRRRKEQSGTRREVCVGAKGRRATWGRVGLTTDGYDSGTDS